MAIPADDGLLRRERSALVAIDLQERLMPAIADGEAVAKAAGSLIDAARMLDVPVVATEQYPKGLGPTVPPSPGACPTTRRSSSSSPSARRATATSRRRSTRWQRKAGTTS